MPDRALAPVVTVIVPAHNAAQTLRETLDSLLRQTHAGWEAIVVDDGSTDDTRAVAAEFAQRDDRFRVFAKRRRGKARARNLGIEHARGGWLLFQDADDLLLPTALERLVWAAATPTAVDWVYCAWARITRDGSWLQEPGLADAAQAFAVLARYNPFAINSCLVRRELVLQVGAFDPRFPVAEDWDLWQRLARAGARMRALPETLALYRMRPGSSSADVRRLLVYGRRIIRRGHRGDRRVRQPNSVYARGMPVHGRVAAEVGLIVWASGMLYGQGHDPTGALPWLPKRLSVPDLAPAAVAKALFISALLPRALPPTAALDAWARDPRCVDRFLRRLERRTGATKLAARVWRELAKYVLDADPRRPASLGPVCARAIEITQPLLPLKFGAAVERLRCQVHDSGVPIGEIELPVCDGSMPRFVLADAIAGSLGWSILGRFFERNVYLQLRGGGGRDGDVAADRSDGLRQANGNEAPGSALEFHERVGWTVLLQEAWGRPGKRADWFYDPDAHDGDLPTRVVPPSVVAEVEVSEELPVLLLQEPMAAQVAFLLCGRLLWACRIEPADGRITAARLRAALMASAGAEFCRAVVREGLIGQSWDPATTLRDRLKANRASKAAATRVAAQTSTDLLPGWQAAIDDCLPADAAGWLLGRHPGGPVDSSASRYACLPVGNLTEIRQLAAATGQPLVTVAGEAPSALVYAPGVDGPLSPASGRRPAAVGGSAANGGHRIEAVQAVALPILCFEYPGGGDDVDVTGLLGALDAQLSEMKRHGFKPVALEEWAEGSGSILALSKHPVSLTFDGEWWELFGAVRSIVVRHGFAAMLFVPTQQLTSSDFAAPKRPGCKHGLRASELGAAQRDGISFGCYGATGEPLTIQSPAEIVTELVRSRMTLEAYLNAPVTTLSYPGGAEDGTVQSLAGAVGFRLGVSGRQGVALPGDNRLALPRVRIGWNDTPSEVVRALSEHRALLAAAG